MTAGRRALDLLARTTREVAAAETPDEAVAVVLAAFREALGADVVTLLRSDQDRLMPAAGGDGYPLVQGGQVVGVLMTVGLARERLAAGEATLLPLLDLAAVALRNDRLADERARAEEAVRVLDARFRVLIERGWDGVHLLAADGSIVYESPQVAAMLGYTPEEMLGRSNFEFLHPDDIQMAQTSFSEFLSVPGARAPLDVRVRHKDGDYRLLECSAINLLDEPALGAVVVHFRDVTERRAAERESRVLHQAALAIGAAEGLDARLERVLDAALELGVTQQTLVVLTDLDSEEIEVVAARGERVHVRGYRQPRASGLTGDVLRHNRAVRIADQAADPRTWQPEHGTRMGMRSWMGVPLADADGAFGALIVLGSERDAFTDDHQRRLIALASLAAGAIREARLRERAERAVAERRQAEDDLDRFFGLSRDLFCITGFDGTFKRVNAAWRRVLGYEVEELLGRSFLEFVHPEDRNASVVEAARLVNGAEAVSLENRYRCKDGSYRWLLWSSVPHAEHALVYSTARDVTERAEAERQREYLAQSEKLRALGQMASGIAHDLNQSLGLVTGYTDLLRTGLLGADADRAELLAMVEVVQRAAVGGGDTVKRLLTFARQKADVQAVPVHVGALLREAATFTAPRWRDAAQREGRPISLAVEAEGDLLILGSASGLREALTNLVFNAVDALPRGGSIRLAARSDGARVIIEVTDSGLGMANEVRARIFEPFFTTKGESGTGLGLAQVYGIVHQHGGEIAVRSAPAQGTTFTLTFPAVEAAVASEREPAAHDVLAARLRILVVDDEPALARMAALILGRDGHDVTEAHSGEDALELLECGEFDVVLSDYGLGEGINGFEFAARVTMRWPRTRFLLATGWGAGIDSDEARAKGVESVLAKPYRATDLLRAVEGRGRYP